MIFLRKLGLNLICSKTEQEEIFMAYGIPDLNVGAVKGSDRERSIHGELHIPCSGGFFAGRRYLLAEIRSRIDLLTESNVVIGKEHDLQTAVHIGIVIDDLADRIDELDDELS